MGMTVTKPPICGDLVLGHNPRHAMSVTNDLESRLLKNPLAHRRKIPDPTGRIDAFRLNLNKSAALGTKAEQEVRTEERPLT